MKKAIIYKLLYSLTFSIITLIVSLTGLIGSIDNFFMDTLYQTEKSVNQDIIIVSIDDKSLEELGKFNEWSRSYYTTLINKLNSDNHNPAVIGFDILFTGTQDSEVDKEFATTCNNFDNIVIGMNLLFNTEVKLDNESLDSSVVISGISKAYEDLYNATESGYVNTIIDSNDGYIRKCIPTINFKGKDYKSFSYKVYEKYQKYHNSEVKSFEENKMMRFNYSSMPNESYTIVSFSDVINDKIPLETFEGSIVLVGAFAEGLQDSFFVPISRGEKMHGVQIHANIIESYFNDYFMMEFDLLLLVLLSTSIIFLVAWFTYKSNFIRCSIICASSSALVLLLQTILFKVRLYASLLSIVTIIIIIYIVQIVYHYVYEKNIKTKALKAFKKYVDPQVVDNVIKQGNYNVILGGEKVDIACLFVDIRGFTTISESLDPTEVVEIINEYLSLTSNSILNNKGTLDKYIGDATMAIYNAPFRTDDYVYNAVLTGIEIAAGSEAIEKKFLEKYNKRVSFGIGINCGKAVVGNIGSNFRMDYTAIGDTVNTAARLESCAKPGEILISEAVYEIVKDKIDCEFVEAFKFKGKNELVNTYRVTGLKK